MRLPTDPAPFAARRARLADKLQGQSAWIPAGAPVSRNYPAARYPFRASSHFLYLTGAALPGAHLVLEEGEPVLFLPLPADDDALWHGETPSPTAIGDALGLAVRPAKELAPASGTVTVAAPDAETRSAQQRALGRAPGLEEDARLLNALVDLRAVHDEHAVAGLREAAVATVAAHRAGMAATRPGATEHQVRTAMVSALGARGMGTAYRPIVSVHGEVLHNEAYENTCRAGDLLLADVGAETSGGWAGDVTRTWPVSGAFSDTQRAVYEVVLESQRRAIAKCVPGTRYRDVHLEAALALAEGLVELGLLMGSPNELVDADAHALFFPHGVGHLIGLDVHDMEDLSDRAGYAPGRSRSDRFGLGYLRLDRDLEPGMAVTIEPGFYLVPAILDHDRFRSVRERFVDEAKLEAIRGEVRGIRIEDDVLITEGEPEVLTEDAPRAADEVESAVGTADRG